MLQKLKLIYWWHPWPWGPKLAAKIGTDDDDDADAVTVEIYSVPLSVMGLRVCVRVLFLA